MAVQSMWNRYLAFESQVAKGSQASGAGGKYLRIAGGAGGNLSRTPIASQELRYDTTMQKGRLGPHRVSGSASAELSLGSFDELIAAFMRESFGAADLAITQATMTSITTTASTIVAAAGSWITQGLRVGDIIRLTGHSTAGNNSRNLTIVGLTALIITVAETLTLDAGADATFTVTRTGRPIRNPAAGAIVERYYTMEEGLFDVDLSELYTDCKWTSLRIGIRPNGLVTFEVSWSGTGQHDALTTGTSPHFTTPTSFTSIPFSSVDAVILLNGVAIAVMQEFDLTIDLQPNIPDTIGTTYGYDVMLGQQAISANFSILMEDYNLLNGFKNETQYSIQVRLEENEAAPEDFISIFLPNVTLGGAQKSGYSKSGGPTTMAFTIPPDLIGRDDRGGAYAAQQLAFQVSNAA